METSSPESARAQRSRLLRLLLLSGGGIGVLFLLGRACGPSAEDTAGKRTPQNGGPIGTESGHASPGFDDLSIGQEYKASVASQGHRVSALEHELAGLRRDIDQLKAGFVKASASQEAQIARLEEIARGVQALEGGRLDLASIPGLTGAPKPESVEKGARLITFEAAPGPPPTRKALRIPAASSGEATVLNGVFAPTGGEPSPIRLRLDSAILGPSKSRIPLRDAILIGKAAGDANSTRVTVELVSFSYVKPGGQSIEIPIRGYVVGEDGMEGIPGSYLYRLEDQVPLAVVTEGAAGFASALAERETTRSVTPLGGATSVLTGDPLKYAGLKAAAGTSSKVGDILAERMRELRPAVWSPADKRVKVVFLEGVTLEGMEPQEARDGEDHPFRDLDPHR